MGEIITITSGDRMVLLEVNPGVVMIHVWPRIGEHRVLTILTREEFETIARAVAISDSEEKIKT